MKTRVCLMCAVVAATTLGISDARATTVSTPCSVSAVAYDKTPRLVITCGGTHYYGFGTDWSGCNYEASVDTLKTWQSMASTAFLTGKKLKIGWDAQTGCSVSSSNGARAIDHIWLVN